ncbi:hypothetical protein [Chryseobacterium sp. JM1]|uniref:hypothetical protein n=1 Tax=Chryseobacterium sp. JM1 TaxID=1233950 RepID=UPI00068A7538|nr:hypothetical protein [Chryseobacterium sp. JM1]
MDRLNTENDSSAGPPQDSSQQPKDPKAENSQKMEEKRSENEKKDKNEEGLLLAIHGAKIKFNAHLGEFKVLNDVPTTQGKLTGTVVEKQIPNFTFYDGFKMISLTAWQDFGTAKVQDNYVLLKKSTLPGIGKMPGNIPPETGKIEFVTSGQINEPESVDAKGAPAPPPPVSVSIGNVIRGNPYVEKNASVVAGMPDSVPLNKTYEVEVTVTGTGSVDLSIINSNADNGNASVTPSTITATTTVIIKGTAKTNPGHGGQLKIEAKVAGVVKATSPGFTVCCHPINYTDTYAGEVYTSARLGVIVQDGWSSDNGVFADLKEIEIKEVVDYVGKNDSPPFQPRGGAASNSGYLPGDQLTQDTHSISRAGITLGKPGITEANQLCIYKCKCCGANDIVHPNSGFQRIHEVFNSGTATAPQWKHRTKKIGAAVTINGFITGAGNANVVSLEHSLP